MGFALVVREPDELKDQIFELDGDNVIVGRIEETDIQIIYRTIGRRHFRLTREKDGGYIITDLGAGAGTYVNDTWLRDSQRLTPGDVIVMGKVKLEYVER